MGYILSGPELKFDFIQKSTKKNENRQKFDKMQFIQRIDFMLYYTKKIQKNVISLNFLCALCILFLRNFFFLETDTIFHAYQIRAVLPVFHFTFLFLTTHHNLG